MGKSTRFHPISLNVIRGSLDMCGYKASRIVQNYARPDLGSAHYTVYLTSFDSRFVDLSQGQQVATLQQCFMQDIDVLWAGVTSKGHFCFNIRVHLDTRPENGGDLDWPASQREG